MKTYDPLSMLKLKSGIFVMEDIWNTMSASQREVFERTKWVSGIHGEWINPQAQKDCKDCAGLGVCKKDAMSFFNCPTCWKEEIK